MNKFPITQHQNLKIKNGDQQKNISENYAYSTSKQGITPLKTGFSVNIACLVLFLLY